MKKAIIIAGTAVVTVGTVIAIIIRRKK